MSPALKLSIVAQRILMLTLAVLFAVGVIHLLGDLAPSPSHQPVSAVGAPSYVCAGNGGIAQAFVTMSAPGLNEYAVVCRDGVHDTASW